MRNTSKYFLPITLLVACLIGSTPSFATQLTDVNLGNPAGAGSATYSSTDNTYTLTGIGTFGGADYSAFGNFDYLTVSGNFDVSTKILSSTASTWSGVLAINSLNSQDPYAASVLNTGTLPGSGEYFYVTTVDGADTRGGTGTQASYQYTRLVRSGSTFSEYVSGDGSTWSLMNSENIAMSNSIYVGLFTSFGGSSPASATFGSVTGLGSLGSSSSSSVPSPTVFGLLLLAVLPIVLRRKRLTQDPLFSAV